MSTQYGKFEFPIIKTERLILKDLTLEDADVKNIFEYIKDIEVTKFMDIEPCKDLNEAKEFIRFHVEDSGCRWGLTVKESNVFIGTCGFHQWDKKNSTAEIGYDIGKKYWGQGFMYETLQAALRFGFDSMELSKIIATIEVDNERSIKLVKRLGFNREDGLRDALIYFYLTKSQNFEKLQGEGANHEQRIFPDT